MKNENNNKELEILSKETINQTEINVLCGIIIDYIRVRNMPVQAGEALKTSIDRLNNTIEQLEFYREYYEEQHDQSNFDKDF